MREEIHYRARLRVPLSLMGPASFRLLLLRVVLSTVWYSANYIFESTPKQSCDTRAITGCNAEKLSSAFDDVYTHLSGTSGNS